MNVDLPTTLVDASHTMPSLVTSTVTKDNLINDATLSGN